MEVVYILALGAFATFLIARQAIKVHKAKSDLLRELALPEARACQSARALRDGDACALPGVARARGDLLASPLTGVPVVGYRLTAVIEPGAAETSRRKIVDLTRLVAFELEDGGGERLLVNAAGGQLLSWPPTRHEVPFSALAEPARQAVIEAFPAQAKVLASQYVVFWAEWVLRPGDRVKVIGAARATIGAGDGAGYRSAPRAWELHPREGRLFRIAADEKRILAGFANNPMDFPGRFLSAAPETGPRLSL